MKTEQLYGEIVAVLNKYETMQNAKALYERGIRGADWCPFHELADLALDLREQMNREAAKSAGRGNARTAMLRIIKNASELRPTMRGAWMDDGRQVVCDGYRVIRLNTPLDLPEPEQKMPNGEPPVNVKDCYPRNTECDPLPLPSIGELKAYIKAQKAEQKARGIRASERRAVWDFGEGLPMVNAEYLLDAMEALPGCKLYASAERPMVSPITVAAESGDGLILPIRKVENTNSEAA